MSCSKEALDDINEAGRTDVDNNIVARVALTQEEYNAMMISLEMAYDVCDYGEEFRKSVDDVFAKLKRERKT